MRPSKGRISLWPAALIGLGLVLAMSSITPILKLKAEPPSDFVALRASAAGPQAALATAYWNVAVRVIRWKYHRGNALPEQVPKEFNVLHETPEPVSAEARNAYWAKLREEWLRPENWQTTYDFDWSWPIRNAQNISREVVRLINQS